jgi:drug/metabolite transporter (DMT)-like permease
LICVARKEWKPGQWALGTLGGLLAVIANILMFRALTFLDLEHRKYLFFPMAVGGCILIYTVYQLLTGRETFSVRKLAGVGVGSVGIALLGMKV